METVLMFAGWGALAYLLGAVPFGFLLARLKGVDIRKVGSGNVGATNVFRSVGKPLGLLTFFLDALKGFIPVWLFPRLAENVCGFHGGVGLALGCGALAIVGHNWPVFLGFKGGKGVATSAGVLLGLAPLCMAVGLAGWVVVFLLTRYVSVASIAAALIVAASAWFIYRHEGWFMSAMLMLLAALIVWRHKSNIRRLFDGTEHRFEFGRGKPGGEGANKSG